MTPTDGPRPARDLRRGRLAGAALLLALTLPAAATAPVLAASPDPSLAPDASAGPIGTGDGCFLVEPTGSPAPAPSLGPSASPLPVREGTIPAAGGILTPGQAYSDWSLGPTLSFTAGDCWAATPVDAGFGLALVWGGAPVPSVVSLTEFQGLVFQDPCLATSEDTLPVDATPDGLIGDLAQSPYLIVSEPVEAELGGLPAVRVEVATQQPMGCEPPSTWIWAAPGGGGFVLEDGEQATFLLAELNGRTIVASWESYPGGDFEALTTAAESLLATLTIDPSTDVPDASPEPGSSAAPASPASGASTAPDPSIAPEPLSSASPEPSAIA